MDVVAGDQTFIDIMTQLMVGIFKLFSMELNFPPPLGDLSPGNILLFFSACYLIADTMGSVAERRD